MKDRSQNVTDKEKTGKKNERQKFRKEGRKKDRDIVESLAHTHTHTYAITAVCSHLQQQCSALCLTGWRQQDGDAGTEISTL
jgi:hypothetical protein